MPLSLTAVHIECKMRIHQLPNLKSPLICEGIFVFDYLKKSLGKGCWYINTISIAEHLSERRKTRQKQKSSTKAIKEHEEWRNHLKYEHARVTCKGNGSQSTHTWKNTKIVTSRYDWYRIFSREQNLSCSISLYVIRAHDGSNN